MRLLVTRPLDDAQELAATLTARGHEALVEPLLIVSPDLEAPLPLEGVQGLLFTSANGVRAFALRSQRRDLPAYAVGDATAAALREVGFARVETAAGDVAALARLVAASCRPGDGPLLHVAGTVVAGDLAGELGAHGFEIRRAVLYRAEPVVRLSDAAVAAFRGRRLDGVLFFSPRTARAFVELVDAADLRAMLHGITAFALSPAVRDALGQLAFRRVVVAAQPNEPALLAAIDESLRADPPPSQQETPTMSQETNAALPPAAAVAAPRRGWVLPVVIVGIVAVVSLAFDVQTLMRLRDPAPAQLAAETAARLDRIERAVAPLQPVAAQAGATAQRLQQIEATLGGLGTKLDALAERLGAVERDLRQEMARPREPAGADPASVAAVAGEAQKIAGDLQKLRDDVARATAARTGARARDALLVTIGQLRESVASGRAFRDELAAVRALTAEMPALNAALDRLAPAAAQGAAPHARLKDAYAAAATRAIHAARLGQDDGAWWRPLADRVTSLVSIRRVGEVEGDDVEAVLARAERRLEAGDLPAAIAGVATLKDAPAAAMAEWLALARARAAIDAALAELARNAAQG
ncbi:MAG: uroporphyrinogen-III synthase [Alphaproteobacteria bacterium]|nr:uroporphyrinogen-III synthase [Alphaproteobacteria bacterium]